MSWWHRGRLAVAMGLVWLWVIQAADGERAAVRDVPGLFAYHPLPVAASLVLPKA